MEIQKIKTELPAGRQRIETGALQINDDWPGTFIRGDSSFYYAMVLEQFLEEVKEAKIHVLNAAVLKGLVDTLKESKL